MKTKVFIPSHVHRKLANVLLVEASAQDVSIFQACRDKTKAAVAARGNVIEWIRLNLRVNRSDRPMTVELAVNQPAWPCLSLPIVGYIMGCDHSTIHCARTRWNLARLAEKKAAEADRRASLEHCTSSPSSFACGGPLVPKPTNERE